jgi:hypothetical protein
VSNLACPCCDRSFLRLCSLVSHAHTVHLTESDEARKVPKKTVKEDGKTKTVVPYVTTARGTGGECGDCPKDPARLPAHPNCKCEPAGGWDDYLATAREDVPENWTKKQWHAYVDTLRAEKVA